MVLPSVSLRTPFLKYRKELYTIIRDRVRQFFAAERGALNFNSGLAGYDWQAGDVVSPGIGQLASLANCVCLDPPTSRYISSPQRGRFHLLSPSPG